MLTFDEAKKIGIEACVDKIGRAFVEKYRDTSSSAYGDREDHAYCFLGVNDQPEKPMEGLWLSSDPKDRFPYIVRCNVSYKDGKITFLDCVLPSAANA